jgi:hypothetical protein
LVIVTADQNIMKRRLERDALIAAGTWAFVLTSRDQTHDTIVRIFDSHRSSILSAVTSTDPPAVWRLNQSGLHRTS